MFPGPFRPVHRTRPVRLVSELAPGPDTRVPSRAVEVAPTGPRTTVAFQTPALRAEGWYDADDGRAGIDLLGADGERRRFSSRRARRIDAATNRLGLALTGSQVTLLSRAADADPGSSDGEEWTVRARVDLAQTPGPDGATGLDPAAVQVETDGELLAEGRFGRMGLRDLHLATHADGEPVVRDGDCFFTATHAGPGFFATAHCGVWRFDPTTFALTHTADLWFERDGKVLGDHAVHLVRDGDRWLVTASTWGDFDHDRVSVTIGRSDADLLHGEHVLAVAPLDLGEAAPASVGTWDPHLTRIDGHWHLALVVASKFFVFRPVLLRARRPGELADWELLGDARGRTATEGTQILRLDGRWRVLASDGRDNPARLRKRFPVFDLRMREVATLDAPYPSNLPWPSLLHHDGRWLMVTFDGTPHGGRIAGYGTHGDVWVLAARP